MMGAMPCTSIYPPIPPFFLLPCSHWQKFTDVQLSVHCRQIRNKLEDLKDAPRPSHLSLSSSLTHFLSFCLNFKPFSHAPSASSLKRSDNLCDTAFKQVGSEENNIQCIGSDLKSSEQRTVLCYSRAEGKLSIAQKHYKT